jgi:indolepyruvate ferredoxin oxidoreductase
MRAVLNTAEMPTGDVVRFRDAELDIAARLAAVEKAIGSSGTPTLDAARAAEALMGDTVYANVMMLGLAWQRGLVPVSLEALTRAIELNGVAVEANHQAFAWGRLAGADPDFVAQAMGDGPAEPETLEQVIARREGFLTDYQDAAYAGRYRRLVDHVRAHETVLGTQALTDAVARGLFRLMAYKDEYEVARLHTETGFLERLKDDFEGDFKVNYYLAPPLLPAGTDARGRPRKRRFGPWLRPAFKALARMKRLRGTVFDPFGHTAERRMERGLIDWYEGTVRRLLAEATPETADEAAAIAALALEIRGYGPVKAEAVTRVKAEVETRLAALGEGRKAA